MCRSIKTLFNSGDVVTKEEIEAASLQFVRKVSGFRKPSRVNEETYNKAVLEIAESTQKMLNELKINRLSK